MTQEERFLIQARLMQIFGMLDEEGIETAVVPTVIPTTSGFEIKSHDEPERMTWHDAMKKFGPSGSDKEWRLPTRLELDVMYENKDKIPNLNEGSFYWSSRGNNYNYACTFRFRDGAQSDCYMHNGARVRCVRR